MYLSELKSMSSSLDPNQCHLINPQMGKIGHRSTFLFHQQDLTYRTASRMYLSSLGRSGDFHVIYKHHCGRSTCISFGLILGWQDPINNKIIEAKTYQSPRVFTAVVPRL
ncbi:hypothetical protein C368_01685 [Cryptococcus neoformans 125.91]|nr:hypothetical protein C368_01685 [Cryptococcus neoformans var. grubii 125.91]